MNLSQSYKNDSLLDTSRVCDLNNMTSPIDLNISTPNQQSKGSNRNSGLESLRERNFLYRVFRRFEKGSLRGSVISFMRMSMGIGIFLLPYCIADCGALFGGILLVIAAFVNYLCFTAIYDVSEETRAISLQGLVQKLMGRGFKKIFVISLIFDHISTILIYLVISWRIFEVLGFLFNFFEKAWLIDIPHIKYDENNEEVRLIRAAFFCVIFVISLPSLLKNRIEHLRGFSICFIIFLTIMLGVILATMRTYWLHNTTYHQLEVDYFISKPSFTWIESFFVMLFSFSIQTYVLDIKRELYEPQKRRLIKITKISLCLETLLYLVVGVAIYLCLGNMFTPSFLLDKYPINQDQFGERILRILMAFFLFFIILSLPVYNPSLRNILLSYCRKRRNKTNFIFFSVFPFFCISVIAFFLPYMRELVTILALTFYNINAYLIPLCLKLIVLYKQKANLLTKLFYMTVLLSLTGLSTVGVANIIIQRLN